MIKMLSVQDPVTLAAACTALVTALGTAVGVIRAWIQQAREQGAKERAHEASIAVAATQAGVDILKGGMETMQTIIVSLQGQVGELKGQLKEAHIERDECRELVAAQNIKIAAQEDRIQELEKRLAIQ